MLLVLCLGVPPLLKRWTYSFHLARCDYPPLEVGSCEVSFDEAILEQGFHYVGRGSQSFVFRSEDGHYVLKLFFFDREAPTLIKRFLGKKSREVLLDSRTKAIKMLQSCHLAMTRASKETGLLYMNLNPSDQKNSVRIYGPAWHVHNVPIYRYRFALQKCAVALDRVLLEARERNDHKMFDEKVVAIQTLLQKRNSLGISNCDRSMIDNCGFVGDEPIEMDFANYVPCTEDLGELPMLNDQLSRWIKEKISPW